MLNDNGLDPDHSCGGVVMIPAMVSALIPAAIAMPTPVMSVTAIPVPVVTVTIIPTPISIIAPVPALIPVAISTVTLAVITIVTLAVITTVTLVVVRAVILVVGAVILVAGAVILAVVIIVVLIITAALPISVAVENLTGIESSRQEINCFAGIQVPGVGVDPEEDEGLANVVIVGCVGRDIPCKADVLIAQGGVVNVEGLDQRSVVSGQFPNYEHLALVHPGDLHSRGSHEPAPGVAKHRYVLAIGPGQKVHPEGAVRNIHQDDSGGVGPEGPDGCRGSQGGSVVHQGAVGVGDGVVPGNGVVGQDQQGQGIVDGGPGQSSGCNLHEGSVLVAVDIGIHP